MKVVVLAGGRSSEHVVSLESAKSVLDGLEEGGHDCLPIVIGRVTNNPVQLERGLLNAGTLKLQRQARGHVGVLLQQFLIIRRLLEQLLAAFGPMVADQPCDKRKYFDIPRVGRVEPGWS